MDLLEPLDNSDDIDDPQPTLNQNLIMDEHSMESDDVPDPLSPRAMLDENQADSDVSYSFRSSEASVTYGVLKVEEDQIPIVSGFNGGSVPQVLTSNNGHVYVIGNPGEIFVSQTGTRAIAPRPSITQTNSIPNIRKRDDRRRATHNEVERRRRDKINNWISRLAKIIPESYNVESRSNGQYDGQSKGGILAKACEYITELRDNESNVDIYLKENKRLSESLEIMKQKTVVLDKENKALREVLKRNGIEVGSLDTST